jgi:hypothetical protein
MIFRLRKNKGPERIARDYVNGLENVIVNNPKDLISYTQNFLNSENVENLNAKLIIEFLGRGDPCNLTNSIKNSYVVRNSGLFYYPSGINA